MSKTTPPTIKDFLIAEFKTLSGQAVDLRKQVTEAKTSLKKEYFGKKLKKMNKKVYAIMLEIALLDAKENPKTDTLESEESNEVQ